MIDDKAVRMMCILTMKQTSFLLLLVASGCATVPYLSPLPAAQRAQTISSAMVEAADVRVTVDGRAWDGEPYDLGDVLLPLLVTVENNSQRPVRIRYPEFALVGQTGFRYTSIPPLQADGQVRGMLLPEGGQVMPAMHRRGGWVVRPRFGYRNFFIAPWYRNYYPGFGAWWGGPFAWDPYFYPRAYSAWPLPLPTRDMMERAMPEGVVAPGGRVSGFVYFPTVRRERWVNFEFKMVDAEQNEQTLGTITIPLEVRS
ncbi:MAG: hypothetical protein ACKVPX_15615 [Myxococcaceae bacterium]